MFIYCSKRLSNAGQPESMLWRASSEMVTSYILSCLRCGKFRDCADKLGNLQQLKLAIVSVGAKLSADGGIGGGDGRSSSEL